MILNDHTKTRETTTESHTTKPNLGTKH